MLDQQKCQQQRFYYMTESIKLNFYSKYSLARQKKKITSLYELIPERLNNTKSTAHLHFKIPICKESKYEDKNSSSNEYSENELIKSFSYLRWLHQSQKQQFLHHTNKQQLKRYASLTQSSMSKATRQFKRQISSLPPSHFKVHHQIQQQKQHGDQCFQIKSFSSSDDQQVRKANALQQLHQSIQKSNLQVNQVYENKRDNQQSDKQFTPQPSQPLQAQIQSKVTQSLPNSCINKNRQKQMPDKILSNDFSYDQQDFNDAFDIPIKQSKISQLYQQKKSSRKDRIQSLKSILIDLNQQNQNQQAVNHSQIQTPLAASIIKQDNLQERVNTSAIQTNNQDKSIIKAKKMNFKAIMAKNKGEQVKNQRNKKLLLNFFDQN